MNEDSKIFVPISVDIYKQINVWRLELCQLYSISEMDMETFISLLLIRSEVDASILLWHLEEGLDAFKDFRKHNDN